VQVSSTGGGSTPLGGVTDNTSSTAAANVTVNAGGTLVGLGSDCFGYYPDTAPAVLFINGGTVTDSGTANYRITLPNLTFTGGTLTSVAGTNNVSGSGNYSLFGTGAASVVTTLSNNTTAVISAGAIGLQQDNQATGTTTFNVAAGNVTGGPTPGVDLLVSSIIMNYSTEVGGLTKTGSGVMAVTGANTYTGATAVNGGTLEVNGSLAAASAVTVAAAGTLAGTGDIGGTVTVNGTLAPGTPSAIGTLTVETNVTLSGTALFKINTASAGTNDVLAVTGGAITYGGALVVSNTGGPLTAGTYQLFKAGSYLNSFSSIQLPALGANLAWQTNLSTTGSMSIISVAPPTPPQVLLVARSGGNIVFSGTNGPASGTYYVLSSTNLALPVTNWTVIATNTFNAGSFSVTNPITAGGPPTFFTLSIP
jgi:autotransporter-associated beta strand protein